MTPPRQRPATRGFTLMEVMITLMILGILMLLFHNTVSSIGQYARLASATTRLATGLRTAQDSIDRELRQASAESVEIDSESANEPPYSRIKFRRLIPYGTGERWVRYYQKGDKLYVKIDNTAERVLLNSLRQISFVYPKSDEDSVVQINFVFQSAVMKGQSKTLQGTLTTVRIMNP